MIYSEFVYNCSVHSEVDERYQRKWLSRKAIVLKLDAALAKKTRKQLQRESLRGASLERCSGSMPLRANEG
jgi:tellurite resistance protein